MLRSKSNLTWPRHFTGPTVLFIPDDSGIGTTPVIPASLRAVYDSSGSPHVHYWSGGISRTRWENSCGAAGIWWAALPREEWPEDTAALMKMQETWREPYGDRRQELVLIGDTASARQPQSPPSTSTPVSLPKRNTRAPPRSGQPSPILFPFGMSTLFRQLSEPKKISSRGSASKRAKWTTCL